MICEGELFANTAGGDFTPHVVTVNTGEVMFNKFVFTWPSAIFVSGYNDNHNNNFYQEFSLIDLNGSSNAQFHSGDRFYLESNGIYVYGVTLFKYFMTLEHILIVFG